MPQVPSRSVSEPCRSQCACRPLISLSRRLEYVLFVLQLALATLDDLKPSTSSRSLVGLDVCVPSSLSSCPYELEADAKHFSSGTGASAIYPLLAMRTLEPSAADRPLDKPKGDLSLSMLATDIDPHSLDYARKNVRTNDLVEDVSVHQVEPDGSLFPLDVLDSADVCVALSLLPAGSRYVALLTLRRPAASTSRCATRRSTRRSPRSTRRSPSRRSSRSQCVARPLFCPSRRQGDSNVQYGRRRSARAPRTR